MYENKISRVDWEMYNFCKGWENFTKNNKQGYLKLQSPSLCSISPELAPGAGPHYLKRSGLVTRRPDNDIFITKSPLMD